VLRFAKDDSDSQKPSSTVADGFDGAVGAPWGVDSGGGGAWFGCAVFPSAGAPSWAGLLPLAPPRDGGGRRGATGAKVGVLALGRELAAIVGTSGHDVVAADGSAPVGAGAADGAVIATGGGLPAAGSTPNA